MNDTTNAYAGGSRLLKGAVYPALVAVVALAIALTGAFLVRGSTDIDGVNFFVESLSGNSSSFFGGLGIIAPLGFAFGAGVVAAFNPCGFAMLPAYLGLYLGTDNSSTSETVSFSRMIKSLVSNLPNILGVPVTIVLLRFLLGRVYPELPHALVVTFIIVAGALVLFLIGRSIFRLVRQGRFQESLISKTRYLWRVLGLAMRGQFPEGLVSLVKELGRALLVGGSVTAGFVLLFAVAGAVIALGARSVVGSILPWLGLFIGILLTMAGAWLLSGGKLYTALAQRISNRMGDPGQANVKGYFLFGLSYGTASLSCTLPIFLSVVGASIAISSIATSFAQFVLYALGMGIVIIIFTIGMALFKGAMVSGMRKAMPYIQPVGTWLMIIAGTYIVFYWLTIGGLLNGIS